MKNRIEKVIEQGRDRPTGKMNYHENVVIDLLDATYEWYFGDLQDEAMLHMIESTATNLKRVAKVFKESYITKH